MIRIAICTAAVLAIGTAYAAIHPQGGLPRHPQEYFTQPPPTPPSFVVPITGWQTSPSFGVPIGVPITGPVNYHPHLLNGMSVHPIPVKTIMYREEPLIVAPAAPTPVPRPRPFPQ
jgi:hypothetical protein